jgi:antitoxin HigA-1
MTKKLAAVHPGEILREEFLIPMKLTPYALAQALRVPRTRIERLAREKTSLTADTALRLARFFGTTPDFWANLQTQFDLERVSDKTSHQIVRIEPLAMRFLPHAEKGRLHGLGKRGTQESRRKRA